MSSPRHLLILVPLIASLSAVAAEQRGAAPPPATNLPAVQAPAAPANLPAVQMPSRVGSPTQPGGSPLPSMQPAQPAQAPGVQATLPPPVVNPGLPVLPPTGPATKTTPLPPPLPRSLKCDVSKQVKNPAYGTPYVQVVLQITNNLGGRETIPAGSVIEWSHETTGGKTTLGLTLLPGQSYPVKSMQKGVGALTPFPTPNKSSNTCSATLLP